MKVLQSVMARNPDHPGALHLWIHVMEATRNPERAEAAADRLLHLVPAAGHLVHMPSHIYARVGRYADAAGSNELAVGADEDYITQCRVQGFYPVSYYPHNIHFLWFAETMRGRSGPAIEAARKTASKLTPGVLRDAPGLQFFAAVPEQSLVRFGKWEEILREPRPGYDGPLVVGLWHFARGMAYSAKQQPDKAKAELDSLRKLAADPEVAKIALWTPNSVTKLLSIGVAVLEGDLAARKGDYEQAIAFLDEGARLRTALPTSSRRTGGFLCGTYWGPCCWRRAARGRRRRYIGKIYGATRKTAGPCSDSGRPCGPKARTSKPL